MRLLLYPYRLFIVLLILSASSSQLQSQSVKTASFKELGAILDQRNDTTYVVNFWATWCGPCIKELPWFLEAAREFKSQKVRVILVSLDFPDERDSKVAPFIQRKGIDIPVMIMDEPDPNSWMPKVDKTWTGAIPATLIWNKKKRKFYEQPMSRDELYQAINQFNK